MMDKNGQPPPTRLGHHCMGGLLVLMISAMPPVSAFAFEIDRYVIAPGGGRAAGDGWILDATLGQPLAGTSQGDAFELRAGFWSASFIVEPPVDVIFNDRFEHASAQATQAQSHAQPQESSNAPR